MDLKGDSFLGCSAMYSPLCTSETSVYLHYTTQRYIPESCHLHTHCLENLKCHLGMWILMAWLRTDRWQVHVNMVMNLFVP
jgi:hypothetical protein